MNQEEKIFIVIDEREVHKKVYYIDCFIIFLIQEKHHSKQELQICYYESLCEVRRIFIY